jgi:hypothetical protein
MVNFRPPPVADTVVLLTKVMSVHGAYVFTVPLQEAGEGPT